MQLPMMVMNYSRERTGLSTDFVQHRDRPNDDLFYDYILVCRYTSPYYQSIALYFSISHSLIDDYVDFYGFLALKWLLMFNS